MSRATIASALQDEPELREQIIAAIGGIADGSLGTQRGI